MLAKIGSPGQARDTEAGHQRAGRQPDAAIGSDVAQPLEHHTRKQQVRQGAKTEGQHHRSAAASAAAEQRGCEQAVHQATGQPAPHRAQNERLSGGVGRQDLG